jgi:hypothetical protein
MAFENNRPLPSSLLPASEQTSQSKPEPPDSPAVYLESGKEGRKEYSALKTYNPGLRIYDLSKGVK